MRTWDEIRADARPGRAFSNSTHFEVWANRPGGCYGCVKDGMGIGKEQPQCPIFGVALVDGVTPKEWQERTPESLGDYECAEFEERPEWPGDDDPEDGPPPDPEPPVEMEGQLDIFEVYADQVIDRSTTEALEAAR